MIRPNTHSTPTRTVSRVTLGTRASLEEAAADLGWAAPALRDPALVVDGRRVGRDGWRPPVAERCKGLRDGVRMLEVSTMDTTSIP